MHKREAMKAAVYMPKKRASEEVNPADHLDLRLFTSGSVRK